MPRSRQDEPDPKARPPRRRSDASKDRDARRQEVDEARSRAWSTYSDATRDLTGDAYDEAEPASWARLQRELDEIGETDG